MPDDLILRGPRMRRPARLRLPVRENTDSVPLGVLYFQAAVALLVIDAQILEMFSGIFGRARASQLVGHVLYAKGFGGDQLQRVGLVVTGQAGAAGVALAFDEAEQGAPAAGSVFHVGDVEADVIYAAQRDHSVTRTGRRFMPLKKLERRRSGGPVSSKPSTRFSISSKVMRTSRRARCAPRQWWMPPGPNAMCLFGSRLTSKMSGFSKTSSSRLPDTSQVVTFEPAGIPVPASSVSSVVVRRK